MMDDMNAVRSIQKWLTFGLSAGQGAAFERLTLLQTVYNPEFAFFLMILPLYAFVINDYSFFGLSWNFDGLLALRFALIAYAILLLKKLRRLPNHRSYYQAIFL
jgi:hypothetical protein